jgi:2-amino-4-hydroxy-6-hydroxymethyldihydropteridine diphosphokinase
MPEPVLVTLGSNIEPEANLPAAVRLLARRCALRGVSRVYESVPVGPGGERLDQPAFLNAAVWIATDLSPSVLKHRVLRPIERRLCRIRYADRYAPRTIDLDLVVFGDLVLPGDGADPVLPDPEITMWPHVALPLADLAPGYVHPVDGRSLRAIAADMDGHSAPRVRADVRLPWPRRAAASLGGPVAADAGRVFLPRTLGDPTR